MKRFIKQPSQFAFGANWKNFLPLIDAERIQSAEQALCSMLEETLLSGKTFLDAGCGSGLFSLAARHLGARVTSFDFDPGCVSCTEQLKQQTSSADSEWTIAKASVLDESYLQGLPDFDVVYSWGVLHHTGNMKKAIDLLAGKVKHRGIFYIAIANDQGFSSRVWWHVKRLYGIIPRFARIFYVGLIASFFEIKRGIGLALSGKDPFPVSPWREKKRVRGMSIWHDWIDWCGGFPFEVAKPEEIIIPLCQRGFTLINIKTCLGGWGCNEYIFRRENC